MRRQVITGLVLIGVAACGGSAARPVEFAPRTRPAECELKPGAPPDAQRAREKLLDEWRVFEEEQRAYRTELAALGQDLGVRGDDESVVVSALASSIEALSAAGCSMRCGRATHCAEVTMKCTVNPTAQPLAEELAGAIKRHWPKMLALKDERPGLDVVHVLASNVEAGRCDYFLPHTRIITTTNRQIESALTKGSLRSIDNECPISAAACKVLCGPTNGDACEFASNEKSFPEEERIALHMRACDSEAALGKTQYPKMAVSGCTLGFEKAALDAHPALRESAGAALDHICAADPPTLPCAIAIMSVGPQDWFHQRPLYTHLRSTLTDKCEAMGAERCGLIAMGYRTGLDPTAQQKVAGALRKMCAAGAAPACGAIGDGAIASAPVSERAKDLTQACELSVDECWEAAKCFESGGCDGLPADPAQAKRAYKRLCDDFTAKTNDPKAPENFEGCKKAR